MNSGFVERGLNHRWAKVFLQLIVLSLIWGGSGCNSRQSDVRPLIKFTKIPPAENGGPDKIDTIEGSVLNARPGQQIVLYAKSGVWWVQPFADRPFTPIQSDSNWQ